MEGGGLIYQIHQFNIGLFSLDYIYYSKCESVVPLKDKKGITITNAIQKVSDKLNHKSTEHWQIKPVNFAIDQWNHGYKIML